MHPKNSEPDGEPPVRDSRLPVKTSFQSAPPFSQRRGSQPINGRDAVTLSDDMEVDDNSDVPLTPLEHIERDAHRPPYALDSQRRGSQPINGRDAVKLSDNMEVDDDSDVPLTPLEHIERDAHRPPDALEFDDDSDVPLAPLDHIERESARQPVNALEFGDDSDVPLASLEHIERPAKRKASADVSELHDDFDSDVPLEALEHIERDSARQPASALEFGDDSDVPLASLEHVERPAKCRASADVSELHDDFDSDVPLTPLEHIERDSARKLATALELGDDSDVPLASLEHIERPAKRRASADVSELHYGFDSDVPLEALEHIERDSARQLATAFKFGDDSDVPLASLEHIERPAKRKASADFDEFRHNFDSDVPLTPLENMERIAACHSPDTLKLPYDHASLEMSGSSKEDRRPVARAPPGRSAAGREDAPEPSIWKGKAREHPNGVSRRRSDVDAIESDDELPAKELHGVPAPSRRVRYVIDPDVTQDYGIEVDNQIPEVSYPHTSEKLTFEYWRANTRWNITNEKGPLKDGYRYRLWLHEVESVDRMAGLIQKLERARRILDTARMGLTGLALSPYVGAASSLQGVEVTLAERGREDTGEYDGDVSDDMEVE